MSRHYPVVAVGGGPAGISLAIECIQLGMKAKDVLILEKGGASIDAIRQFYPDKKMTLANYKGLPTETFGHLSTFPDLTKAQTLEYFDDLIKKHELQIEYQAEVSKVVRGSENFELYVGAEKLTADFVAVGIGILGRPQKPDYKLPNSLKKNILYDMTTQKVVGAKVLVVGGGDTSSEYCQLLVEEKNEVTLAYRRDRFSRMMESNRVAIERLMSEGRVTVWLNTSVKEVQDQEGKPFVLFDESSGQSAQAFDKILYAIGGTTPTNFLKTMGVEFENEWPKCGPEGQTNVPGLYLTGDLVAGKLGGSIIAAYNASFRTAGDIVSKRKF